MSLKKVEQVKAGKWFRIWDLLIYGVIVAIIAALLIAFAVVGKGEKLSGFKLGYRGATVFTYDFSQDKYEVISAENITVEEGDNSLLITFRTSGGDGYNNIKVDKKERSVSVTASNCSVHKDCVYTSALRTEKSAPIVCTPHAMTIAPLNYKDTGIIIT